MIEIYYPFWHEGEPVGRQTQAFGEFNEVYRKIYGTPYHNGYDIAVPEGTPIYAHGGNVAKIGLDAKGYGWYIKIADNRQRARITYAHLREKPIVKIYDTVKRGDVLGYVGSTGNSTGYHTHIDVEPYDYTPGSIVGRVDFDWIKELYEPEPPPIIGDPDMATDEGLKTAAEIQTLGRLRAESRRYHLSQGHYIKWHGGTAKMHDKDDKIIREYGNPDSFVDDGWLWTDGK